MDTIVWEQLEPVPVRTLVTDGIPTTEYAANLSLVKRLNDVRSKASAWAEAKKLVEHPVLQFIGE